MILHLVRIDLANAPDRIFPRWRAFKLNQPEMFRVRSDQISQMNDEQEQQLISQPRTYPEKNLIMFRQSPDIAQEIWRKRPKIDIATVWIQVFQVVQPRPLPCPKIADARCWPA